MEQRKKTLRHAGRAALYQALRRKHVNKRRWLLGVESFGIAIVLALTTILQVYFEIKPPTYTLDQSTYNLIGESRDDTPQYLSEDKQNKTFSFNVPKTESGEDSVHVGRVSDTYSASFDANSKNGITYTDTESQIGITVRPTFRTGEGRKVDGDHIVYTMGAQKLIYTLKYNGLKEDIIVPKYISDELDYTFDLVLPSGVEARLDEQGNIGIYSSDPTLFGNISFGSDEDRAKVEKARENGQKNHLVVSIPSPIVKDSTNTEYTNKAVFSLGEKRQEQSDEAANPNLPAEVQAQMKSKTTTNIYSLKIAADNLKDLIYPISIDPTIQSSANSDFDRGNFEGGVEIDRTNNLIRRNALTGGFVDDASAPWPASTASITNGRWGFGTAVYNGFMYVSGGYPADSATCLGTVQIGTINSSTGDVTAWSAASVSMPNTRCDHSSLIANGYLYVIGGIGTDGACSSSYCNSVYYSKISETTGALGTFNSATAMPTYLADHGSTVAGNYLYVSGGDSIGVGQDDVYYARLNGDGSVGSWTTVTNSLPAVRYGHSMISNGDFIYILMGESPTATRPTNIYYNRIDTSTGALLSSSWILNSTSFTTGSNGGGATILNGYMYIVGGCTSRDGQGDCTAGTNRTQYAPLNADGSVGTWRDTTAFSTGIRYSVDFVAYNNRLYQVAGCSDTDGNNMCASGQISGSAAYVSIKPAGELHNVTWSSGGTISAARQHTASVAYNGYIYAIGGCNNNNCETEFTTVDYAVINANGSLGTWGTTTALPATRAYTTAVAYNGYIYIVGGCQTIVTGSCTAEATNTYYGAVSATGTIPSWANDTTNPLNTARNTHGVAVYGGYVYVTGGSAPGDPETNDVEYAQINSDGSLGAWTNQANVLNTGRPHNRAIAHNGYLYVIGGADDGGTRLSTVEHALLTNGVPGAFTATTAMNTARLGPGLVVHNGYMYAYGGETNPAATFIATAEYARIKSDGTLDTWQTTQSMGEDNTYPGFASANGVIYAIGGLTNPGPAFLNTVEYQHINNGGTGQISAWTGGTALADPDGGGNDTAARLAAAAIAVNGCMFIIGGTRNSGVGSPEAYEHVQSATINADGNLGTWGATTSLPAQWNRPVAVAYNGYIYVHNAGAGDTIVRYAQITGSCTVGTWTATDSLNTARLGGQLSAYNGYIYMTGGDNGAGSPIFTTEYSVLNSNGTIQNWTNGTSLNDGHSWHSSIPYGGRLYVITGCIDDPTICDDTDDDPNSIEYADITSGVPGSWTRANPVIKGGYKSSAYIFNGYMYIIGGRNDLAGISITDQGFYAPILPNGNLGTWQRTIQSSVTRYWAGSAVYNNRFYLLGGTNGGSDIANVYYSSINSIPRVGSYSRLIDFGSAVKPTKLISRGTKQNGALTGFSYAASDESATTLGTATASSDIGYAGTNALTLSMLSGVTTSHYFFLRYTLDDSFSAVFPDSGSETTLTDYDIYFKANPGQRLRGGRTFTGGTDRGLDAPPQ